MVGMVSPDSTNWLSDCGMTDDIPVADGNFQVTGSGLSWPTQAINGSSVFRLLRILLPLMSFHKNYPFGLCSFSRWEWFFISSPVKFIVSCRFLMYWDFVVRFIGSIK